MAAEGWTPQWVPGTGDVGWLGAPAMGSGLPVLCPFQDDTISINHNWVNGFNLANMWRFLQQELCAVQEEVSEWRDSMPDWHHHCQVEQLHVEAISARSLGGLQAQGGCGCQAELWVGAGCDCGTAWAEPWGRLSGCMAQIPLVTDRLLSASVLLVPSSSLGTGRMSDPLQLGLCPWCQLTGLFPLPRSS